MKFSMISIVLSLAALGSATAIERRQNNGRPVPNGACCTPNTSLKQDFCTVNGQSGKCVPANSAGCGAALTCVAQQNLVCDPNRTERGREFCREKQ